MMDLLLLKVMAETSCQDPTSDYIQGDPKNLCLQALGDAEAMVLGPSFQKHYWEGARFPDGGDLICKRGKEVNWSTEILTTV